MSAMNATELLPLLRETAERAIAEGKALEIRRERGASSAVVMLKGKATLFLEPGTPVHEEAALLLQALRKLDLASTWLPPAVREALERPAED